MKKVIILLLILSVMILSPVSCNVTDGVPSGNNKESTTDFIAGYDYGFYNNDKAILLLSYATVFFNPDDYNLKPLVAADVIHVTHKGDLLIQESYPATVVTSGVEILNITADYADILTLTVKKLNDLIVLSDESGEVSTLLTLSQPLKRYIIFEDESFEELSEKHLDMKIYASGKRDGNSFTVYAYYGYNPRISE